MRGSWWTWEARLSGHSTDYVSFLMNKVTADHKSESEVLMCKNGSPASLSVSWCDVTSDVTELDECDGSVVTVMSDCVAIRHCQLYGLFHRVPKKSWPFRHGAWNSATCRLCHWRFPWPSSTPSTSSCPAEKRWKRWYVDRFYMCTGVPHCNTSALAIGSWKWKYTQELLYDIVIWRH